MTILKDMDSVLDFLDLEIKKLDLEYKSELVEVWEYCNSLEVIMGKIEGVILCLQLLKFEGKGDFYRKRNDLLFMLRDKMKGLKTHHKSINDEVIY